MALSSTSIACTEANLVSFGFTRTLFRVLVDIQRFSHVVYFLMYSSVSYCGRFSGIVMFFSGLIWADKACEECVHFLIYNFSVRIFCSIFDVLEWLKLLVFRKFEVLKAPFI